MWRDDQWTRDAISSVGQSVVAPYVSTSPPIFYTVSPGEQPRDSTYNTQTAYKDMSYHDPNSLPSIGAFLAY